MSRHAARRVFSIAALVAWLVPGTAVAGWMWDQNQDRIDDRILQVETQGISAAYTGGVMSGRLMFDVTGAAAPFSYGVYIGYDHHPTDADVAALEAMGLPIHRRYYAIDYVRSRLTLAQAQLVAQLPGVTRIETIPVMYAVNNVASRSLRARDSGQELFPNVWKHLGVTGKGIVVAILDTGVNDDAYGPSYPGHESLAGKFLGGGDFAAGDPAVNTPLDQSINPKHNADPRGIVYHGTHVAGTAIGTGGPGSVGEYGEHAGLAPEARLVDCKVLTDAGSGLGSADALDWCIYNRNNSWGLTGADTIYRGIDVINMSVGGSSASDGTDANCLAVNAAHKAGIVVCVASGNDGNTGYMPAPGAADYAVTVGAATDNNSLRREDDIVSDYSNEGPRLADGDPDRLDEMKPNVLGSGTGITSAFGDPTTDGTRYHHINGTSMACPTVAGIAALVLSANPSLSSDQVRDLLMDTAEHRTTNGKQPPSASDPFGIDPNYHPSWGWGLVDAYAAVKEALNSRTTQVVRIAAEPQRGPDGIVIRWWSQREAGLRRYELDRAPDVNGLPGAWTEVYERLVASPAEQIHRLANRRAYSYEDTDPSLVTDATYWYRLRWIDADGNSHAEPAVRARIAASPVIARVQFSWTHDYSDGDLLVRFGTGTDTDAPVWFRQAEGRLSADSIVIHPGEAAAGTREHFFHVDLTAEAGVATFLPPGPGDPWFLSVKEGGYLDTHGRVNTFSVTHFTPSGSTTYAAPQPTTETVEKQETVFWIPLDPATSANHNPVLAPVGARAIGEGLTLNLNLSANDPDGHLLTYSATSLPPGAVFNALTRTMSWTPGHSDAGAYSVRFRVFDNFTLAAADSEDVAITVFERSPGEDLAPVLEGMTDRSTTPGRELEFRIAATDPEGEAVSYSAAILPPGAAFVPGNGTFRWTPGLDQVGAYELSFAASDPGGNWSGGQMFVFVTPPGQAPSGPCDVSSELFTGVAEQGIDPVSLSYSYHPFTVPERTTSVHGKLWWFAGPSRDLDFHLLDADSNVVHASASLGNPEELVTGGLPPGTYLWRVTGFTNPDTTHYGIVSNVCAASPVGVGDVSGIHDLSLAPPAPNPFIAATSIRFALPAAGEVSLRVYDLAGRQVRTLQAGVLPAGPHVRVWEGRSDAGTQVAPGVYFTKLVAGGRTLGRKMILVR